MDLDLNNSSLPIFKALGSRIRLEILQKISKKNYSATQLAHSLHVSKTTISKNLRILNQNRLINLNKNKNNDGRELVPSMAIENIQVNFPQKIFPAYHQKTYDIPLGSYFGIQGIEPTCGLLSKEDYIGKMDNPKVFLLPKRSQAQLLWFSKGAIEYVVPNEVPLNNKFQLIELDMELASEFPTSNNNWKSKIGFWVNDQFIGSTIIPGNFSDVRGQYTPSWWPDNRSQYGLLKHLRINNINTAVDGYKISNINLKRLNLFQKKRIKFKISVMPMKNKRFGGLTIFGKEFGNHNQNIKALIYYS